jgi:hypothetical protein
MMKRNNILYAKMICPLCGQFVEAAIEMDIGDSLYGIQQYTIGDRIIWRRRASVQKGGRPGNGNIDAEGFFYSSVCGDRASVKVVIRGDMIRDVIFDQDDNLDDETPSPAYVHQPAQAMQIPSTPHLPNQEGKVTFNFDAEWLTPQRKGIMTKLIEAGVDIYAPSRNVKNLSFRIMIPHGLHPATYIEIAYLMSQLVDENFPEPLVEYVESYPYGVKYRGKNTGSVLDIHF